MFPHKMKNFNKIQCIAAIILLYPLSISMAQEDRELIREKIHTTEKNYRHNKKMQNWGFRKNLWKKEDQDYVKKWINSDINHLQLSIKYKKEYLAWVNKGNKGGPLIWISISRVRISIPWRWKS